MLVNPHQGESLFWGLVSGIVVFCQQALGFISSVAANEVISTLILTAVSAIGGTILSWVTKRALNKWFPTKAIAKSSTPKS